MAKVGARIHFQETDSQTEELDNSEEDTSPQGHQQCPLNFVETDQNTENEEENSYVTETEDLIFNNIKETLERRRESVSTIESELPDESSEYGGQVSDNFTHVPYGLQPKAIYEHAKKSPDIMGITYNGRMRRFVILDGKGITTWQKDSVGHHVTRAMIYPKFEYKLITNLVYARKYNVYFALGKDFTLKVLNRDFEETCHVSSDLRSILFMIFNPVRDELITGGVGGTKVWKYHQVSEKTWTEIKPMANYRLTLQYELRNVGGSWVKKVELDLNLQHLYCCSDTDLYAYNMDGKQIFRFERAHNMSITGCAFSSETRLLVTASVDSEVKAWSLGGGLVHTFRGHSRAVTSLLLHPETSALALTSSLDGSVRIWSLHTMEPLYSTVVSTDGVLWMSLTDDQLLYLGTLRNITLWSLNRTATFWAATRSRVTEMAVVGGHQKSTRVVSVGEDNSVRVFSRRTGKNLSTILPPPSLSPLQHILGQTYNRLVSVGYLLVSARSIWIYTTRTDPACRVAVWDTLQIQEQILQQEQAAAAGQSQANKASSLLTKRAVLHRATAAGQGNEAVCECRSVCYMNARVRIATEEGPCTVLQDNFLLMGLEDGRVLFMDPVVQGKKYLQFTANKDAIVRVTHDVAHGCLWTQCTLGEAALVQVWSLPGLTLEFEVYCPSDVTGYVRLGDSFITAHTNGTVLHHHLQRSEELVGGTPYRPKFGLADDGSESSFTALAKADHNGPVTSIDACHKLGIFCTASPGGTVKVWEAPKVLLTEVVLDASLCTAAFLNTRGDLVVSFRNHLFYVNHAHVCPSKKIVDEDSDSDYAESEIYEDPAVRYEGVKENPDPVDLKNYLVPFNLDFNQDFLEGKQPENEDDETQPDDDDLESELSAAPTDTYLSPSASPRLARLDLTLTAQPSAYELRQHMARIQHTQASVCGRHRRDLTLSELLWDDLDLDAEVARVFSMPRFGESPGPSPTPSPPSTIATPSDFDVSEGGESTPPDSEVEDNDASFTPINKPSEATKTTTKESKGHQKDLGKRASRLDNIKIDSKQLMAQDAKVIRSKVTEQVKDADHSHTGSRETREQQRAPLRATREVKKKVISGSRKRPRAQSKTEVAAKYATTQDSESDLRSKKSAASPHKSSTKASSGSGVSSPRVGDSSSRATKQSPAVSRKQAAGKRSHSRNSKASSKKDRAGTSMSQHKVGFQDKWFNDLSDSNSKNKMHSLNLPSRDSSTDSRHSRSPLVSTPSLVLHPDWLAMQQVKVTDGSAKDSGKDGSVEVKDSGSDASFVPSAPGTEGQQQVEADKVSNGGMPHTDVPHPPLDPRVPSPTATVVSDYGSEWTMGGAETPQIPYIHIGDIHVRDRSQSASEDSRSPAQGATENVRQAKSAGGDSKTASTDADKGEVKRRPHTAVLLPRDRQELEKKFTHALAQYKVEQSSEKEADPLYKNDGKSFDADKMIERHELLRMQKALRAQSARERRAARDRDHKDRNNAILQRNACRLKSQSDCSFFTPDHHKPSPSSAPSWTDPVSGPQDPSSRPVTAVTITGRQRAHSARQDRAPPGKPAVSEDRVPRPPVTEADRAKSQLSEERPYRARIRSSPHKHRPAAKSQLPDSGRIDLRLIDPRSPLAYRHPGAKSIPSKCTRYVFISPPTGAPGHIVPSALEEQLITERFPQRQDVWLGGATRPPTRTCHGVPSLNPRHLVFNRKGNLHPEFVHMSGAV